MRARRKTRRKGCIIVLALKEGIHSNKRTDSQEANSGALPEMDGPGDEEAGCSDDGEHLKMHVEF